MFGPQSFRFSTRSATLTVWLFCALSILAILLATPDAAQADRSAPLDPTGKLPISGTTIPAATFSLTANPLATAEQPIGVVQRSNDATLFVIEKVGKIRLWDGSSFRARPALDISARVDSQNERGLLGLVFSPTDPNIAYVQYTDKAGRIIVSELSFSDGQFDMAKERKLLEVPKPFNEHNAGTLNIDQNGYLFVAIGDGGGSGDKFNNAQNTNVLLGKILRIDPRKSDSLPYTIPPTNPFAKTSALSKTVKKEIFAFGLRNPWRTTLDPTTGDLWVPDVGESKAEEINLIRAGTSGQNFGWRQREGLLPFKGIRPKGSTDPIYSYPHKDGRCAVVGGAVYRGRKIPQMHGWYVFGDVCSGQISALKQVGNAWQPVSLGVRVSYLTAFGVDNDGELYATSLEGGIYKLELVDS